MVVVVLLRLALRGKEEKKKAEKLMKKVCFNKISSSLGKIFIIMNARMVCWNFAFLILVMAKKKLKEQEIIQRTLKDYDWRVRPRGSNLSWPGKKFFIFHVE